MFLPSRTLTLFLPLFFGFLFYGCDSWREWKYSTIWKEDAPTQEQVEAMTASWEAIWGKREANSHAAQPPRGRMGHSLVKAVITNPDEDIPDEDIYE